MAGPLCCYYFIWMTRSGCPSILSRRPDGIIITGAELREINIPGVAPRQKPGINELL